MTVLDTLLHVGAECTVTSHWLNYGKMSVPVSLRKTLKAIIFRTMLKYGFWWAGDCVASHSKYGFRKVVGWHRFLHGMVLARRPLVSYYTKLTHWGLVTTYGAIDLGQHLAWVMACCLMAPSHYLNQCWLNIKNIKRHTADIIVSWPNPKWWIIVHTSDMMIIRQSIYILSIIATEMGKLKTYSPTYCIMDIGDNMLNLTHTLDKIYLTGIL